MMRYVKIALCVASIVFAVLVLASADVLGLTLVQEAALSGGLVGVAVLL